jgi:hypothetical protein
LPAEEIVNSDPGQWQEIKISFLGHDMRKNLIPPPLQGETSFIAFAEEKSSCVFGSGEDLIVWSCGKRSAPNLAMARVKTSCWCMTEEKFSLVLIVENRQPWPLEGGNRSSSAKIREEAS